MRELFVSKVINLAKEFLDNNQRTKLKEMQHNKNAKVLEKYWKIMYNFKRVTKEEKVFILVSSFLYG